MAVYTEVSLDDLKQFLTAYDLGEVVSCKGIAEGVENSNYLLQTERGRYILTLYEKRVHQRDLPFFLGLMEHLAGKGIPCPVPVPARDGAALRQLVGRPAAIVSFLDGVCVNRPGRSHCRQVGENLARLHLAGRDFTSRRENTLGVQSWRPLYESCQGQADTIEPGLDRFIARELDYLEANWPQHLQRGVIHADLFPDNVFFMKDVCSGLIDFYFACEDLLAYDLAICINAWCFERGGEFNATNARSLSQGYMSVNPLPLADITALPVLCRGAALRFLLTRLYDWLHQVEGALVKPKDPRDYVHRLRFHQKASSAESYGLS